MKSTRTSKGKSSSPSKPSGAAPSSVSRQPEAADERIDPRNKGGGNGRTTSDAIAEKPAENRAPSSPMTEMRPSAQPTTSKPQDDASLNSQQVKQEPLPRPAENEPRLEREPNNEDRRRRIAERAYRLYVADGFPEGRAMEHWLQAERELANEREEWDH